MSKKHEEINKALEAVMAFNEMQKQALIAMHEAEKKIIIYGKKLSEADRVVEKPKGCCKKPISIVIHKDGRITENED